jgi:WD40 repeat protein
MRALLGHRESTRSLAYAPDGKTLASGGADRQVKLWALPAGTAETINWLGTTYVHSLVFTPDGRTLAWSDGGGAVIWDVQDSGFVSWMRLENLGTLSGLSIHPDGEQLAGAYNRFHNGNPRTGAACCWTWRDGLFLHPHWESLPENLRPGMLSNVWGVAFAPDGQALAVSMSGGVLIIDWPAGTLRGGLRRGARYLAFAPDGSRLAGAPLASQVLLWDAPTQPEKASAPHVLRGHRRQVKAMAFSPDGTLLATGGLDETVILWDVANCRERAHYDWQVGAVYALAFAPDGMTLAVGGEKGIVICDIDPV